MNKEKIKKILIIRYRFIGDTVLTTPFIKNTKENFPKAQIDVLVSPNSGELLEGNPNLNKIIYLDNTNYHKYEKSIANDGYTSATTYRSLIGCAIGMQKEKYDLVFVLKRSFSSAMLAFLTGAKYRVGFNTECRFFLLTHSIKYEKDKHEIENFSNVLKKLKIEPKKYNTEIFPTITEQKKALNLILSLEPDKLRVGIHMTSAHPYKQWKKKHIGKIMDYLFERKGAQFVFTGAQIDRAFYEKALLYSNNGGKFKYVDLCGQTTLRECYAVYENLDMILCVDSGNAHLAAATGKPTYVLYGPTRPEKWLPIGENVKSIKLKQPLECQPCDVKVRCSHINCMKVLLPEYVYSSIGKN